MNVENRTIFEGDNLHVLRGFDCEMIDLIYLAPLFKSNKTYPNDFLQSSFFCDTLYYNLADRRIISVSPSVESYPTP